jgi:hypothetical protein
MAKKLKPNLLAELMIDDFRNLSDQCAAEGYPVTFEEARLALRILQVVGKRMEMERDAAMEREQEART